MEGRLQDEVDRLTASLSGPHLKLMQSALGVCIEDGQWPFFAWVDEVLDKYGYDGISTLASFPSMTLYPPEKYSAAGADLMGRPPSSNSDVFVTALGVWHLAQTDDRLVEMLLTPFFEVLDFLANTRHEFLPPRREDVAPVVTWPEIQDYLENRGRPAGAAEHVLLAVLKADRPPGVTFYGIEGEPDSWNVRLNRQCQHLSEIQNIEDYLTRRLKGQPEIVVPVAAPVIPSPLDLPTAIDYFNAVWRLAYGKKSGPFCLGSAELTTRLSHGVGTGGEFSLAMTAVGDLIASLHVTDTSGSHPCDRLEARLTSSLPAESAATITEAVDVLRALQRIRHAGQHSSVSNEVLGAWSTLGINYPPSNWEMAWDSVRGHLLRVIDTIRVELDQLTR